MKIIKAYVHSDSSTIHLDDCTNKHFSYLLSSLLSNIYSFHPRESAFQFDFVPFWSFPTLAHFLFGHLVPTFIFLLAYPSRRLIGELLVYTHGPSLSVRRPQCSNIFSEIAWPIKAKFYVEPPWVGGTKICSRHLGHMTKMAATPIYGKNPSKIFSRTGGPIFTKLGM